MARIALVNAPFRSHVAAMLRLADVLVRQGHELIVWAPEDSRPGVEDLGARLVASSPQMPQLSGPGLPAALALTTERMTEEIIAQLHAHDVDLVIHDSQAHWALIAARYLGIPRLVSHPMFPMLPRPSVPSVPSVPSTPSTPSMPSMPEDETPEVQKIRRSIARRWGVQHPDLGRISHTTSEPTMLFTTEEILGAQVLPPRWRCIGPLLSAPPPRCRGGDRPLVYASFGTAQNRRTELFRTVIAAMAGQPVELVISAGGRRLTRADIGELPANVAIHEYLSTRAMLARADIHITHGGSNSVHESLIAGVAMVCLPQAFDQIPLSARIAQLGVGVVAEAHADSVRHGVLSLLSDGPAQQRAEMMSEHLRRYDGETQVATVVAECLA